MVLRRILAIVAGLLFSGLGFGGGTCCAQALPTRDQLMQLAAPFALFPDALVAQICAASTDPQQILDAHDWLWHNNHLQGQALTEAAQHEGFDPAFISLVNFPTVLDMMAENIDDYAALGEAFKADQQSVMAAIQSLRQDAYARGALDSNEYQTVSVQQQGNVQVVVVQPTNPQVVFVPQYQPQQVWSRGPSSADIVAASMVSFGAGIALGSWINGPQPWGWGGWGWGWGGRGVIVHNNVWVVNNRWRSSRPYFRPRPPHFGRPIYVRPPPNWNQRPGRRPPPPGWRPNGPNHRPGGNSGGSRPGGNTGGNRPGGNAAGNTGGNRPGGNPSNSSGNAGGNRPSGNAGTGRPTNTRRPPANSTEPVTRNPYAGFPQGSNRPQAQQPQQRPQQQGQSRPQPTGGRQSGLAGSSNGGATRAASNRGRTSARSGGSPGGGRRR